MSQVTTSRMKRTGIMLLGHNDAVSRYEQTTGELKPRLIL